MKGEIILRERLRRQEMLDEHIRKEEIVEEIQREIDELKEKLENKQLEYREAREKFDAFNAEQIRNEIEELTEIAYDLGLLEREEPAEEQEEVVEEQHEELPEQPEVVQVQEENIQIY